MRGRSAKAFALQALSFSIGRSLGTLSLDTLSLGFALHLGEEATPAGHHILALVESHRRACVAQCGRLAVAVRRAGQLAGTLQSQPVCPQRCSARGADVSEREEEPQQSIDAQLSRVDFAGSRDLP